MLPPLLEVIEFRSNNVETMTSLKTLVCLSFLALFANVAGASELTPRVQSEQCLPKVTVLADGFVQVAEVDLTCYRDCVTFCQDMTDSIYDERKCIDESCLEGGLWSCGK